MLKFGIRLDDRVRTDDELSGKCADSRKTFPRLQNSSLNGVTDLLHQLQVQRLAARWIECEQHGASVSLCGYSCPMRCPRIQQSARAARRSGTSLCIQN